jgi:hypothetical protein
MPRARAPLLAYKYGIPEPFPHHHSSPHHSPLPQSSLGEALSRLRSQPARPAQAERAQSA